jgi:2-amino-4-hydroxy-6-hydroxymethyldihydropteridine diphosphokinase
MAKVFILTGSNRGNRLQMLRKAEECIEEVIGMITVRSSVYETEPWGFQDEIPFLNQVLMAETDLLPDRLLKEILVIETSMGRKRESMGYQARVIDIDILLYNDNVINTEELIIPHPRLADRRFVLMPLAEIAGEYFHPVFQCTISELLVNCRDYSKVVRYFPDSSGKGF